MAESNSRTAPFLTYLTVFKARLATANLILPLTSFAFVAREHLVRMMKRDLSENHNLSVTDPAFATLVVYLKEKKLLSGKPQASTSRYAGWSVKDGSSASLEFRGEPRTVLAAFATDVWMSDEAVKST